MSELPCPVCGAALAAGGTFCRQCGYDEELAEDSYLDGVDLPDEDEPDLDFAKHGPRPRPSVGSFWWLIALLALAAFVYVFVLR